MIIAYDPGFGNDKLAAENGAVAVRQSAVSRPQKIGMAGSGIAVANKPKTIRMQNGREYVAGPGAWSWGDPETNMDYTALGTERRLALFFATFSDLFDNPSHYEIDFMPIGLPVPLMQDELQFSAVTDALSATFKGAHIFQVDGETYSVDIKRIYALNQPLGAASLYNLDEDGYVRKGANQALIAVPDLGMNTFDMFGVRGWELQPRYLGGGKRGVRWLLEELNGHGSRKRDIEALDAELRAGRLSIDDVTLNTWMASVLGLMEKWGSLSEFDAIIPTGGGAAVLGNRFSTAIASKGGAVHWPDNPVTANVEGLYRLGVKIARQKRWL